jgi:hypothetical protein
MAEPVDLQQHVKRISGRIEAFRRSRGQPRLEALVQAVQAGCAALEFLVADPGLRTEAQRVESQQAEMGQRLRELTAEQQSDLLQATCDLCGYLGLEIREQQEIGSSFLRKARRGEDIEAADVWDLLTQFQSSLCQFARELEQGRDDVRNTSKVLRTVQAVLKVIGGGAIALHVPGGQGPGIGVLKEGAKEGLDVLQGREPEWKPLSADNGREPRAVIRPDYIDIWEYERRDGKLVRVGGRERFPRTTKGFFIFGEPK